MIDKSKSNVTQHFSEEKPETFKINYAALKEASLKDKSSDHMSSEGRRMSSKDPYEFAKVAAQHPLLAGSN